MADVMKAALAYAARGYPVFPVRLGGKEPLTPHGFKDATTGLAQILAWSDTWARANVGIATGEANDLVVIDVDEPSGGLATLKEWEAAHGPLPATPTATTPRGGLHFYFQGPSKVDIRSRAGVAPGIDVRASGGFIVAPPSVGANGVRYNWRDGLDLAHPLAPLPEFLLRILLARKAPVSASDTLRVGRRHDTLVRRAGALRAHGDDEAAILDELSALNQRAVPPLPAKEVGDIARWAGALPPGPFPMTDLGNAQRFQLLHGRDLLYDYTRGAWRKWDGARWTLGMNGEAGRRAQLVARAIYSEAQSEPDSERRKRLAQWAILSESHSRIEAMLKQARPRLPAPERFDTDPWLLNVRNGTLDLRTGTLHEHRHEDFISRIAPVDFDPPAKCSTWDEGVLRIMGGDEAKVRYLHRVFGSCLTGITRDQVFFLLYGRGGNGKSTIIETVRAILGDYAGTVRTDALFERGGSGPSEDVARLDGLRMVTAIESGEGRRLHEALVKSLTGGDRLSARFAYGHALEYDRQFKSHPRYEPQAACERRPRDVATPPPRRVPRPLRRARRTHRRARATARRERTRETTIRSERHPQPTRRRLPRMAADRAR